MGSSSTSTILFLLLFVSFYVISLSTYTYITSLSDINLKEIQYENRVRVKRKVAESEIVDDYWTRHVSLHKCCAPDQYLNQKYQCQDGDQIVSPDKLLRKLADYVVDEKINRNMINLSRIDMNSDNHILNLRDENAFAVNWSSSILEENYAFSQEDLSLLLLNENKTKLLTKFSPNSYCLDFLLSEQNLAAFVNPCAEKLCLQKCCPKEHYYNIVDSKCVKDTKISEYAPTFYIDENKIDAELPYYLLTGKLKCVSPRYVNQLQINNITSAIFIQEDGTLEAKNKENVTFYKKQDYCTDSFSDGTGENTFVGGLYCPSTSEIMHDIEKEHELEHQEEKKKDSIKVRRDETVKVQVSSTTISKIFFFEIAGAGLAIILFLY